MAATKTKLRIAAKAGIDARMARKLPQAEYGWVVDATGSSEGLRQAVQMTKPRGTVVMKSTVHGAVGIRFGAGDRERNHPGWLALRPFRAGAAAVAEETGATSTV